MIKVNTEQLLTLAEQIALQIAHLQEVEDQLWSIQSGLREAGTEFEEHISAVDRQYRSIQEERLTLNQLAKVLRSAAEQYTGCERTNLTSGTAGTGSRSGKPTEAGRKLFDFQEGLVPFVVPDLGWKPKPIPQPDLPYPRTVPDDALHSWGSEAIPCSGLQTGRDDSGRYVDAAQLASTFNTSLLNLLK